MVVAQSGLEFFLGIVLVAATILIFKLLRFYGLHLKVDENSSHHGGELVAEVLSAHGVKYLFTLCGGHISPILVACEIKGIRIIDVRHEASAVFAADAVSRLSGTIGVAAVTAGPGVTNTVTAIKNAQMAEIPLVLIGGAASSLLKSRGSLQDIDQLSLLRSVCKYTTRVISVRDIVPVLTKAFFEAVSDTPGPVFVEFPIDTLYPYHIVRQQLSHPDHPKGLHQWLVYWYLRFYLFKLFAGAFPSAELVPSSQSLSSPNQTISTCSEVIGTNAVTNVSRNKESSSSGDDFHGACSGISNPVLSNLLHSKIHVLPPRIPSASPSQLTKIIKLLLSAQKPIIVLGSQAVLPPVPAEETATNVKRLGLPVFTTGMARGLLGRQHPLLFRHARKAALHEADFILLAGVVCDFRLNYGRVLNRNAAICSINRSKEQLYRNSDLFWKLRVGVKADVGCSLRRLVELLDKLPTSVGFSQQRSKSNEANTSSDAALTFSAWLNLLKTRECQRDAEIEESAQAFLSDLYLNPLKVLWRLEHDGLDKKLDEMIPGSLSEIDTEDTILIADGGDFVATASYILRPRKPLSWIDPGPFGTLGVGGGFALGAKLCRPKATVWVIFGDGSCGYSLAEWDTMARHRAPAIALIGNDASWSQIARDQVTFFGSNVACELHHLAYETVGSAYAGFNNHVSSDPRHNLLEYGGFVLSKNNEDQFIDIVSKAKLLSAKGQPSIINCIIGSSNFRQGSISV